MHYFLFCGLTRILQHFLVVKCHISLYQPHGSSFHTRERNDRKLWRKFKYIFCCESLCCVVYWKNLHAVHIFFVNKCNIRELDEFFRSSWLINVEANYQWSPAECAHDNTGKYYIFPRYLTEFAMSIMRHNLLIWAFNITGKNDISFCFWSVTVFWHHFYLMNIYNYIYVNNNTCHKWPDTTTQQHLRSFTWGCSLHASHILV